MIPSGSLVSQVTVIRGDFPVFFTYVTVASQVACAGETVCKKRSSLCFREMLRKRGRKGLMRRGTRRVSDEELDDDDNDDDDGEQGREEEGEEQEL